jgi:light-harvesting protein B-800-850 alpha chain
MNQGRIWCVVNPSVGLPLFLGSVALMSFTVHFAVLNNTTWMSDFFNGVPMKRASVETVVTPVAKLATPAVAVDVAQATDMSIGTSTTFVVKATPKVKPLERSLALPG